MLLVLVFGSLWLAGGASRADVAGQAVVRAVAWLALIIALLFAPRPSFVPLRPVLLLLISIMLLPALQLVPLPPALWWALPGRDGLAGASTLSGAADVWRPLSLVPSATWNALSSLIVPAAVIMLSAALRPDELSRLPVVLMGLIVADVAVALIQLTGMRFDQPLINYTGDVSGTFANHNHFAVLAAIGCLIAPTLSVRSGRLNSWRLGVAAGVVVLIILAVLASGSRAGMAATGGALLATPLLMRGQLRELLSGLPRWMLILVSGIIVLGVVGLVSVSFVLDRATSINRLLQLDVADDMRSRALPVVLAMTREYFPAGIGFGGFDPLFRYHEPFSLLKPTYFNEAHNDLLGIALDGGAAGLLLLIVAIGWWLWASVRVWRERDTDASLTGRLASVIILLIIGASIVDYPVRTPIMMAVVALAAMWLARATASSDKSRLPHSP